MEKPEQGHIYELRQQRLYFDMLLLFIHEQ